MTLPSKTSNIKLPVICTVIILLFSFILIFTNLGQYALWDDEAGTALFAEGVWRTGDTSAIIDHNIVAYRSGAELENLHNRYFPPLGYYVAAPFVGLLGNTAFAARLPFAAAGFWVIVVMVIWMWERRADNMTWLLMTPAILCNVSFMLYTRQSRYYSLAILFTTIISFLYVRWKGELRSLYVVSCLSILLFATNYLNYLALYVCLLLDFLIWKRKEKQLSLKEALLLFIPQIIVCSLVLYIWNPLGKGVVTNESTAWLADKITLFLWYVRDFNTCEFGVWILIIIAPCLYLKNKNPWLLRLPLAMLIYTVTITLLSPQPIGITYHADIRYLVPLIPLSMFIAVLTLKSLPMSRPWLIAIPMALLAFSTNLFHGGHFQESGFRMTVADYVSELKSPPASAYEEVSRWINSNIKEKQTVWAVPIYAAYPLIYHAPKALYAWQLKDPPAEQFKNLPDEHFRKRIFPDYIIIFGPEVENFIRVKKRWETEDVFYRNIKTFDLFWAALNRPELFWHGFREETGFNKNAEAIYIYKKYTTHQIMKELINKLDQQGE